MTFPPANALVWIRAPEGVRMSDLNKVWKRARKSVAGTDRTNVVCGWWVDPDAREIKIRIAVTG